MTFLASYMHGIINLMTDVVSGSFSLLHLYELCSFSYFSFTISMDRAYEHIVLVHYRDISEVGYLNLIIDKAYLMTITHTDTS